MESTDTTMTVSAPSAAQLPVDAPGAVRLARNALASLARGVVTVPLTLVVAAIVLDRLGPAAVGIAGILGFLVNPIVTFDFGIVPALTRHAAARRDRPDEMARLVATGLAAFLAIVAALTLVYLGVRSHVAAWLSAQSGFPVLAVARSLDLAWATQAVLLSGLAHAAALNGLERIPDNLRASTAHQVLLTVLVAVCVHPATGLPALFACSLAASLVQVAMQAASLERALGVPVGGVSAAQGHLLRLLAGEAFALSGLSAFRVGFVYLDKWLLTAALGSAATGYYELGSRIGVVARAILNTMCVPLLSSSATAATSLMADAKLSRLSYYSLRYLIAVSLPLVVLSHTLAASVFSVWLGRAPDAAVQAQRYLVPSYLLNAWAWSILYQMVGEGLIAAAVLHGLGALALNLAGDLVVLGFGYGYGGVLAVNAATSVVLFASLVRAQVRRGRLSVGEVSRSALRLALAAAVAGAALFLLPLPAAPDRFRLAAAVAVQVAVYGAVYVSWAWFSGEVDEQDRYFLIRFGNLTRWFSRKGA